MSCRRTVFSNLFSLPSSYVLKDLDIQLFQIKLISNHEEGFSRPFLRDKIVHNVIILDCGVRSAVN